jgi:putative peptide zinc metalloprotease protein
VRWMPVVKHLFSKWGAIVWFVVVIAALATIIPTYGAPGGLKEAANNAIDPKNWLFLWATFVFIKFIHECGHAFACRRFGGEVHEMGIMFLVFIPTPYVDASTAWAFPNKWARMFVGAAGMIVEIFFAAICAFIWRNTNSSELINQLAYNAMLIASVSTVLFNANPLLRYDGYYMLSDYLEIPNLQQKSREYLMGLIKRHVFRIKSQQPLPPPYQRVQLFVYGLLSTVYRVFIGLLIIIMVTFKVPVLGVLMALGGVVTWIVTPVVKLFKYLTLEPELHRKRGRAWAFSGAVAAAIVLLIGIIPFPMSIHAEAVPKPLQEEVMRAESPGFVEKIAARDGDLLKKGDVILVASDPELTARKAALAAQIEGIRIRMRESSVMSPAQHLIDQIQLEAMNEQMADVDRRIDELTIRAPFDGSFIAPKIHELNGRFLSKGQDVGTVAILDRLQVYAALEQKDAQLAFDATDTRVEMRMVSRPSVVLHAEKSDVIDLPPAPTTELRDATLGQQGGGLIQTDPRDPSGKRTMMRPFELRAIVANPGGFWCPGQRAYVRLKLDKKPLIWQWTRRFLQLIQSQNNKWM